MRCWHSRSDSHCLWLAVHLLFREKAHRRTRQGTSHEICHGANRPCEGRTCRQLTASISRAHEASHIRQQPDGLSGFLVTTAAKWGTPLASACCLSLQQFFQWRELNSKPHDKSTARWRMIPQTELRSRVSARTNCRVQWASRGLEWWLRILYQLPKASSLVVVHESECWKPSYSGLN